LFFQVRGLFFPVAAALDASIKRPSLRPELPLTPPSPPRGEGFISSLSFKGRGIYFQPLLQRERDLFPASPSKGEGFISSLSLKGRGIYFQPLPQRERDLLS
jgi:hypothetical protein